MITERVKDIISRIVRTMGGPEDLRDLERKLFAVFDSEGYAFAEVREAFDIILRLLDSSRPDGRTERRPLRMLCPDESVRLTRRARSWLFGRYYGGEIGLDELEAVLNAVVMQEHVMDEQDLGLLAGMLLRRRPETGLAGRETIH